MNHVLPKIAHAHKPISYKLVNLVKYSPAEILACVQIVTDSTQNATLNQCADLKRVQVFLLQIITIVVQECVRYVRPFGCAYMLNI